MEAPWTVVLLSVSAATTMIAALAWLAVRLQTRVKLPGAWMASWCAFATVKSICRVLQDIGWSAHYPVEIATIMLITLLAMALSMLFFLDGLLEEPPGRVQVGARIAVGLVTLVLLFSTELLLTSEPHARPTFGGRTFMGAAYGPLLMPTAALMEVAILVRLITVVRATDWRELGRSVMILSLFSSVAAWATDITALSNDWGWIRVTDYVGVPVALAFMFVQTRLFAQLFSKMGRIVDERTASLERANHALRDEFKHREALQHKLAARDKFEALGRLAGGVAHDFNNLLTVITGSATLLKEDDDGNDPERAETIDDIQSASDKARGIVKQLLTFAKELPSSPKPVDVAVHLEQSLPILRRMVGPDVEVVFTADGGSGSGPTVSIDPAHLDQIVLNLVKNGRDAMLPGGGRITVDVTARTDDERPHVRLRVADTGMGMPPDVVKKIFEPFFSTKQDGGTGLGLATVLRLVEEYEGEVTVESEPAHGTTFEIHLPIDGHG